MTLTISLISLLINNLSMQDMGAEMGRYVIRMWKECREEETRYCNG